MLCTPRARAPVNTALLERYRDRIAGVLTCYDRIVITGACLAVAIHAQRDRNLALAAGIDEYIVKPIDLEKIAALKLKRLR